MSDRDSDRDYHRLPEPKDTTQVRAIPEPLLDAAERHEIAAAVLKTPVLAPVPVEVHVAEDGALLLSAEVPSGWFEHMTLPERRMARDTIVDGVRRSINTLWSLGE
jgi:hypothetical protein